MFLRKLLEKKRSQHTFVYCPKCNNEMVHYGYFIEETDGIVKYRCSKCGNISFWDFAHFPVPYLRTCTDCRHLEFNNIGKACCNENCDPQTQVLFAYKVMTTGEAKGENNADH